MKTRLLLLVGLAACSNKPPAGTPVEGRTAPDAGGRTAATSDFGREPVEVVRQGAPIPVVAVALEALPDVDRVTFTFDAGLPGHRVAYVDTPTHCGSGEPAAIDGKAFLEIRMTPAVAHDDTGQPRIGPVAFDAAAKVVADLEPTCDFEGEVTWVIGVREKKPFATRELLGPQRLVVEVQP